MLPLLLIFTAFEITCGTACYHTELPDIRRFAVIAPLSSGFERRRLPEWNVLAVRMKAAENRDVPRKGRRVFINAFY
jgi:hypothetical protein